MKKSIILHAKFFPAKILFNKKFFDFNQIFWQHKKHFKIKFLKFLLESDNFLLNTIFCQSRKVGVNYVTSDSASVEAVGRSEVASLVWTFRWDFNSSLNNFEPDLNLRGWPQSSSVQSCLTDLRNSNCHDFQRRVDYCWKIDLKRHVYFESRITPQWNLCFV